MASKVQRVHNWWCSFNCSVADPDPNPDPDPRIHVFLGLLDPDPDPLVRYGSGSGFIPMWILLTLDFYCIVTFFLQNFAQLRCRDIVITNFRLLRHHNYEITTIASS
jgi:hypothetical protein